MYFMNLHDFSIETTADSADIFSYPKPPGNRRCADWNLWKICKLMTIPQLKSGFWLISLNPPQGHKHPKPSHAWLAPSLRVSPSAINSQVNTSHVFFHSSLQKVSPNTSSAGFWTPYFPLFAQVFSALWIQKVSVFDFSTKTPRGSSSLDLSSTCISCCQWNQTLPGAEGNGAGPRICRWVSLIFRSLSRFYT